MGRYAFLAFTTDRVLGTPVDEGRCIGRVVDALIRERFTFNVARQARRCTPANEGAGHRVDLSCLRRPLISAGSPNIWSEVRMYYLICIV